MRRFWPVLVVVGLQLAALALLPFRSARARLFGQEITLRTAPVDPFDLLAGRHVVLRYAVEDAGAPGQAFEEGQTVWIVVAEGQPAWELVAVAPAAPPPSAGRASLRATWRHGRPSLEGAGRLYLPEAEALEA
ncbi:MAG TPA: GDYXXLXY domain-containing protein, partial [Planctomycetota bacterium]